MSQNSLQTKGVVSVAITYKQKFVALQNSMIKELYFIEDIFCPSIVGKIIIEDKFNIKNDILLTGHEIISVIYGIDTDVFRNFHIYKINKIENKNTGSQQNIDIIEILFADISFFIFSQKQISYSWREQGGDEIIKELLTVQCKFPESRIGIWENDGHNYEYYYSPYWNVLQNVNYLLPRMSSGNNNDTRSGFLFYSSTEDINNAAKFNLTTLQKLLSQTELLKIGDTDDGNYPLFISSSIDIDKRNKILDWTISGTDKTAFNILQGGKAIGFDSKSKQPMERQYTYAELVGKTMVLGHHTLFSDISDDTSFIKVYNDGESELLDNVFYDEWVKKYCLQQIFTITVQGHEKRCCGKMIYIPWRIKDGDKESATKSNIELTDHKYTGGFLIKSVTHYFKPGNPIYYQKMSLIKNGYQKLQSADEESVLKQTNQQYVNAFDESSFTTAPYVEPPEDSLFNRKSNPENEKSGLLQMNTNAVDTKNLVQKALGWLGL